MVEETQRSEMEHLNQRIVERLEFRLKEVSRVNTATAKQIKHWIDDPARGQYIEDALFSLINLDQSFLNVSLITLDSQLSEVARVERVGNNLVFADSTMLRSLGHIKSLKSLNFDTQQPQLTEITKNHIRSLKNSAQIPVIYSVVPISGMDENRVGLLTVIRIDKIMETLKDSLDPSLSLITANSKGLYLFHPFKEYVFSFTRNAGHNISSDFPGISSLMQSELHSYYLHSPLPWDTENNLTYISKTIFNFHGQEHCYYIGTSKPSSVLNSLSSIYTTTFTAAAALTFVGLLLSSGYISNWIISPITVLSKISNEVDKSPKVPGKYLARDDEIGTLANAINIASGNIRDNMDALESSRDSFKKLAILDPLTQIPNRTCFDIEFPEIIEYHNNAQRRFALLFVDVDYFKTVNDTLGHIEGDAVLSIISSTLQERLNNKDTVFRVGGDEFAIILADIGEQRDITKLTEELRTRTKTKLREKGYSLSFLDISIGIATFPDNGIDKASLIAHADSDMYQRKRLQKMG